MKAPSIEESRALLAKIKAGKLKVTKRNFHKVGLAWTDVIIWGAALNPLFEADLLAPCPADELFTEEAVQVFEVWLSQACRKDPEEARRRFRRARERMTHVNCLLRK